MHRLAQLTALVAASFALTSAPAAAGEKTEKTPFHQTVSTQACYSNYCNIVFPAPASTIAIHNIACLLGLKNETPPPSYAEIQYQDGATNVEVPLPIIPYPALYAEAGINAQVLLFVDSAMVIGVIDENGFVFAQCTISGYLLSK